MHLFAQQSDELLHSGAAVGHFPHSFDDALLVSLILFHPLADDHGRVGSDHLVEAVGTFRWIGRLDDLELSDAAGLGGGGDLLDSVRLGAAFAGQRLDGGLLRTFCRAPRRRLGRCTARASTGGTGLLPCSLLLLGLTAAAAAAAGGGGDAGLPLRQIYRAVFLPILSWASKICECSTYLPICSKEPSLSRLALSSRSWTSTSAQMVSLARFLHRSGHFFTVAQSTWQAII